MKVRFIVKDVINFSDKLLLIPDDTEYDAVDDGDFIMIRMPDNSTIKAPKSEIDGILEII